jgi:MoxR-like ATPase
MPNRADAGTVVGSVGGAPVDSTSRGPLCWVVAHARERKLLHLLLTLGLPTLIGGPRGCGKTLLALKLAFELERPCEVFHLGGIRDAEAHLYGVTQLRGGETFFVRSRFVEAIQKPGMVIILDELNRAPSEVLNALLSLLDDQARLVIEQEEGERRIVPVATGVTFVATINHGAEYVGSEPIDAALLDRFALVRLNYPENEVEILESRGIPRAQARQLARWAKLIRAEHQKGTLPFSISLRGLNSAARLIANGLAPELAIELNVAAFDDEGVAALRALLGVRR